MWEKCIIGLPEQWKTALVINVFIKTALKMYVRIK
jgi:hypothetical protein